VGPVLPYTVILDSKPPLSRFSRSYCAALGKYRTSGLGHPKFEDFFLDAQQNGLIIRLYLIYSGGADRRTMGKIQFYRRNLLKIQQMGAVYAPHNNHIY